MTMTQAEIAQSARDEANHREDYRRIKNDQLRVEHCGSAVLTEVDDGVVTIQHWLSVRPGRNRINVRASEKFIPGMGLVLQADEDTLIAAWLAAHDSMGLSRPGLNAISGARSFLRQTQNGGVLHVGGRDV